VNSTPPVPAAPAAESDSKATEGVPVPKEENSSST